MSTSDLYRVFKTTATHLCDYRNGWGTAPILWDYLCRTYLGREGWYSGDNRDLWALAHDLRVPRDVRMVHAFTFTSVMCPCDRISEMADACDAVSALTQKPAHVNHWSAIAATLRTHKRRAKQIGVALSCTSVEDQWIQWKGGSALYDIAEVIDKTKETP